MAQGHGVVQHAIVLRLSKHDSTWSQVRQGYLNILLDVVDMYIQCIAHIHSALFVSLRRLSLKRQSSFMVAREPGDLRRREER